jgi:hypothetical protein
MVDCIDLAERFGTNYRVTYDPAYDAEGARHKDAWYMQLAGRKGIIYPHGGDRLAAEVDGHPGAAKALAAVPGVTVHQDGGWGGEMTFVFHVHLFGRVAEILRPRRRRRLTTEQRERLVAAGHAARFCAGPGPRAVERP